MYNKPLPQIADFPIPDTTELEVRILATNIQDPTLIPEFIRRIKPEMFSDKKNRQVWETILGMFDKKEEISMITILPKVDKKYYIEKIAVAEPTWGMAGVDGLIGAFLDTYIKRNAYVTAVDVLQKVNTGITSTDIAEHMSTFKDRVANGLEIETSKNAIELANELADDLSAEVTSSISSTIPSLDYYTYGGFKGGNLVILAARPSVGKTTIALQTAINASRNGKKTKIYSLEMTGKELVQSLILSTGYITPSEYFSRSFDWSNYERAVQDALSENLFIDDHSNGVNEICHQIRLDVQMGKCDYAVIDYLGLMAKDVSRNMTLASAIGMITKKLKQTAKDCKIPILLLCQLNRNSASEHRAPQLYDLRDSGDIEQDADIVLMLESAKDDSGMVIENAIDIWLRKNRNGRKNKDNAIRVIGNETYSNFKEQ